MESGFFPATSMPNADWWQALWPDAANVIAEMGVKPGMVAVDLGCGDGLFTAALADIAAHVYAIDIDPDLLNPHSPDGTTILNALDAVFI